MKRKRTIIRCLTALLLLVVFLAVHIGKALHTHNVVIATEKVSTEAKHTIAAPDCSICDYHLAKDSAIDFSIVAVATVQEPVLHIMSYQSRHTASIGLSYADRGPPSKA
jgi:hypothetical protein